MVLLWEFRPSLCLGWRNKLKACRCPSMDSAEPLPFYMILSVQIASVLRRLIWQSLGRTVGVDDRNLIGLTQDMVRGITVRDGLINHDEIIEVDECQLFRKQQIYPYIPSIPNEAMKFSSPLRRVCFTIYTMGYNTRTPR